MHHLTNIQKKSARAVFLIASGFLFLTCCSIEYWLQNIDSGDMVNQSVGERKNDQVILTADGKGRLEPDDGEFPTILQLNPDDGKTLTNGAPGTPESTAGVGDGGAGGGGSSPPNTGNGSGNSHRTLSCSLPKPQYPNRPSEPASKPRQPRRPSDPCAWYHRLSAEEKKELQPCVTPASYHNAVTAYNSQLQQYNQALAAYQASSEYQQYQQDLKTYNATLVKYREDWKTYRESCEYN